MIWAWLSDDFAGKTLKAHWQFLSGSGQIARARVADGKLHLRATGAKGPGDSPPLGFVQGDPAFELEFDLDVDEGVQAGVVMLYIPRLYAGVGANAKSFQLHRYGQKIRAVPKPAGMTASRGRMQLKLRCARHVLTLFSRADARQPWIKFPVQMDVSGYHHNTAGGFASLRPAI